MRIAALLLLLSLLLSLTACGSSERPRYFFIFSSA